MSLLFSFIAGYLAAFVGIFPPGLINMTAAKLSLEDGKSRAMGFVSGALAVIAVQTFISVYSARYIDSHHEVNLILREIGLVIFVLASIYFFFLAKKPELVSQNSLVRKTSRSAFLLGLFIGCSIFILGFLLGGGIGLYMGDRDKENYDHPDYYEDEK